MNAAWKLLLALLLISGLVAGLAVLGGATLLAGAGGALPAVTVHIDGETYRFSGLGERELLIAFAVLTLLLVLATLLLPLALLLGGVLALLGSAAGLIAVLAVFALLLLPLWLPLLWWWRRRATAPPAAAAP